MTIDPRPAVIDDRLAGVKRIFAVTGGKGGIGKSLVSTSLALALVESGRSAGLLDLDLTAPTDHVILGLDDRFPTERWGVEPPEFAGVRFMSVSYFAGEATAPLRGVDFSNALLELLAITRWQELDVLVIDMPPGLGDAMLDAVRHIPRAEYVAVATASRVVLETVRRTLELLRRLRVDVAGVVENMRRGESDGVAAMADRFGLPLLGTIAFDPELEAAIGSSEAITATRTFEAVRGLRDRLL